MSALVRARSDGRHIPASHPVARRRIEFQAELLRRIDDGSLHAIAATAVADQTARIEHLAQSVVLLPDTPLTVQQRRSLTVIARELLRRAQA